MEPPWNHVENVDLTGFGESFSYWGALRLPPIGTRNHVPIWIKKYANKGLTFLRISGTLDLSILTR